MTTFEIIQLCIIAIAVLGLAIYIIVMAIKNKWVSKIWETIKTACKEAEKLYPNGNGDKKKEYVLQKVEEKCVELGVPYKLLAKLINKLIEQIVEGYNAIKK